MSGYKPGRFKVKVDGMVPGPKPAAVGNFLRDDGTWQPASGGPPVAPTILSGTQPMPLAIDPDFDDEIPYIIPGPQGLQGPTGPTGPAGAGGGGSAAPGAPGLDAEEPEYPYIVPGPAGPQGPIGPTGPPGTGGGGSAAPGIPGLDAEEPEYSYMLPGPAGPKGVNGAPGAAGLAGPPGMPGMDAEDEIPYIIPGPAGNVGTAGGTGPAGAAGAPGPPGSPGLDAEEPEMPYVVPGPQGPRGATGPAGGGGGTLTVVEVNLGATAKFEGRATITDAAVLSTSKISIAQAPGPYTGKGTLADEAAMDPIWCFAAPGAGQFTLHWKTLPVYAPIYVGGDGKANVAAGINERRSAYDVINMRRIGIVRGNVKFQYTVA